MHEDLDRFSGQNITSEIVSSRTTEPSAEAPSDQASEAEKLMIRDVLAMFDRYRSNRMSFLNDQTGDTALTAAALTALSRIRWQLEDILAGHPMNPEQLKTFIGTARSILAKDWEALALLNSGFKIAHMQWRVRQAEQTTTAD